MKKTRPFKKTRYLVLFLTICLILTNVLFAATGNNLFDKATWTKVSAVATKIADDVSATVGGGEAEFSEAAHSAGAMMAANYTNLGVRVTGTTPSTCSANGTIKVAIYDKGTGLNLTAGELASLTGIKFDVPGSSSSYAAPYSLSGNTFTLTENPSGTFSVGLKYTYLGTEYTVTATTNAVIGGNYVAPTVALEEVIPSFSCRPVGRVTVKIADGTPNYKLELIPTGASTYKDSIKNITSTDEYTFNNVPMGTYKVKVTDNCNSTAEVGNIKVIQTGYKDDNGNFVPSNFPREAVEQPLFQSWDSHDNTWDGHGASNCQKVAIWGPGWVGGEHTIQPFWFDLNEYYQISNVTSNPNPASVPANKWTDFTQWNSTNYLEGTLTSANYQVARQNDEKLYLHMRVIDANGNPVAGCPIHTDTLHFHNPLKGYYNSSTAKHEGGLYNPYAMPYVFDGACSPVGIKFGYPGETHVNEWIVCYPYQIYVYDEGVPMPPSTTWTTGQENRDRATNGTSTTLSGAPGGLAFYQSNVTSADYINIAGSHIQKGHTYYYKMIDAAGATLLGEFTVPMETRIHSPQNFGVYAHNSCGEQGQAMWVGSTRYYEEEGWWDLWESTALPIGTKVKILSYPAGVPSDWMAKITANHTITITNLDKPVVSVFDWEAHDGYAWMDPHTDFPEGNYTFVVSDPNTCYVSDTITYTLRRASYSFGAPTVRKGCEGLKVTLPAITGTMPFYGPTLRGETTRPNQPIEDDKLIYSLTSVKDKNGDPLNAYMLDPESNARLHFARPGQTVLLPTPGEYHISPGLEPDRPCESQNPIIIDYPDTRLALDAAHTYGYGCPDGYGVISVHAIHGQGKIKYEIISATDGTTTFPDAISGATNHPDAKVFNIGVPNVTYRVRMTDSCQTSIIQDITAAEFSNTGLILTDGKNTNFCAGDDVTLSAVAMPSNVTYRWYKVVSGVETQVGTDSVYTIHGATAAHAGTYRVRTTAAPGSCYNNLMSDIDITISGTCLNARNDYYNVRKGVAFNINELLNDSLGTCNRNNIEVTITQLPYHGNVVKNANNTFTYTSGDYMGLDSLRYQIKCGTQTDEAWVILRIFDFPDNIEIVDCYGTAPAFEWSIKETFRSVKDSVSTYSSPMVGDLDGDGIPEIMAGKFGEDRGDGVFRYNNGVYVFWGNNPATPTLIKTKNYLFTGYGFAAARVKIGGEYKPMVVVAASFEEGTSENGYLFAYTPDPAKKTETASRIWKSDMPIANYFRSSAYTISFADFDGDGNEEICAGGCIFDAATGKLLAQVPAGGNLGKSKISTGSGGAYSYAPVIADVNEDGKLEYVAGTEVYSVNITNRTGPSGNNVTLISSIPAVSVGSYSIKDGATVVADIDRDGHLDVIVRTNLLAADAGVQNYYGIMVWNPRTQQLMAKTAPISCTHNQAGVPFIGNIDNEPNLEILLTTVEGSNGRIDGYRWDGAATLNRVYQTITTDLSGETGITLFDFNQDGVMELVYRDQTHLRIMHAESVAGTLTNLATFEAGSATGFEYPVVADVDNDGHAEIVTTGGDPNTALRGTLRVYQSGSKNQWAPARPVWNQYMYNVLNVNKDLTIPKYPFNPATAFAGNCGGKASDPHYPYNGFLMQQTILNQEGCPLWLLPKIEWVGSPVISTIQGDSIVFTGTIKNTGEAGIIAPIYITAYKNSVTPGNVVKLDSITADLNRGSQLTFRFVIKNVSGYAGVSKFIINVNDNKTGNAFYQQCNVLASNEIVLINAVNDYAVTGTNRAVTIHELTNDFLGECTQANIAVTKLQGPFVAGATAELSGKDFIYTPATGFQGKDSIQYQINCNGTTATAWIYVTVVNFPDNIEIVDCYGTAPAMVWDIAQQHLSDKTVNAYGQVLAGPIYGENEGVKLIALNRYSGTDQGRYLANAIRIFNDSLKWEQDITFEANTVAGYSNAAGFPGTAGTRGLAMADVNGDGLSEIFVLVGAISSGTDQTNFSQYKLRCYQTNGTTWSIKWTSNATYQIGPNFPINIADIDNDGQPEILVGKHIFDALAGTWLCTLPGTFGKDATYTNPWEGHNMLADMDNDGKLEAVCGPTVYKIDINRTGTSTVTPWKTLTIPGSKGIIADGHTAVADLDLDGNLDVVVNTISTDNTKAITYAWSPAKGMMLGDTIINGTFASLDQSIPFIGDVDKSGYPNIVGCVPYGIYCLGYNPIAGKLEKKWSQSTTDKSGRTAMTLFDFNLDGQMEIVYRDQTHLRIINGQTGRNRDSILCSSPTGVEYPIVVEANKSGHAVIVVIGAAAGITDANADAYYMRMYSSKTPGMWASARPVWNQYAYNAVNINKDLKIPKYQFNPATAFDGNCGGTALNPHRPYNGFLVQQTMLNQEGCPLWLMPKIEWVSEPTFSAIQGDSIVFTGTIKNTGEAGLLAPIYITAYKNSVALGNVVKLDSIRTTLNKGQQLTFTFVIKNVSSLTGVSKLIFNVNDNKTGSLVQPQCNVMASKEMNLVLAINDYAVTGTNRAVTIHELTNDFLGECTQANIAVAKLQGPFVAGATAELSGKDFIYTPATGFQGKDSIQYQINCNGAIATAWIYVAVIPFPDNIEIVDCFGEVTAFNWTIALANSSRFVAGQKVSTEMPIVVGDINGDSFSEIVTFGGVVDSYGANSDGNSDPLTTRNYQNILIFSHTGELLNTIANTQSDGVVKASSDGTGVIGLVRLPKPDGRALIVMAHANRYLYAFDSTGAQVWKSTDVYGPNKFANIGFADFNHDGWPEIHVEDRVFDAQTGKLLATATEGSSRAKAPLHATWAYRNNVGNTATGGNGANNFAIHQMAADVLGTGSQQLIYGNEIHQVTINSRTDAAQNSITLAEKLDETFSVQGTAITGDGHVGLADFDLDGEIDVLVSNRVKGSNLNNYMYFYLWNPRTGEKSNFVSAQITAQIRESAKNIPMIGDIDGDGIPEVVLMTDRYTLKAFIYNKVTNSFTQKWSYGVSDNSASTTLTMFDFNQDGKMQLVYRDEGKLRILDGSGSTVKEHASIFCGSFTGTEYPVIADIDNDGHAEIIVTGNPTYVGEGTWVGSTCSNCAMDGQIMIFKGASHPWAPARSVWNQYSYNAVNVNKDLTIPKYQFNLATAFDGACSAALPLDPHRPYNAFLAQQTRLNQEGCPLWLAPKIEWVGEPTFSAIQGDSIVFTGTIKNTGNAGLIAPIYITAYKNSVAAPGNVVKLDSIVTALNANEQQTFNFVIKNVSSLAGVSKLIFNVNDKQTGTMLPYQPQCNVMASKEMNILIPFIDYAQVHTCYPSTELNVLASGLFACTPANTGVIILTDGQHGSAVADANGKITYTPNSGYEGKDSIFYHVLCSENSLGSVWMHIAVVKCPDNIDTANCWGVPQANPWDIELLYSKRPGAGTAYTDYVNEMDVPLVGDLSGNGDVKILAASSQQSTSWMSNKIHVFDGKTGNLDITLTVSPFRTSFATRAIAKVNGETLLYVFSGGENNKLGGPNPDHKLHCYKFDFDGTGKVTGITEKAGSWPTGDVFSNFTGGGTRNTKSHYSAANVMVADIDADGTPEVFVYEKVFNAQTGALRLDMNLRAQGRDYGFGAGHNTGDLTPYFPVLADMDNDGQLELVAGRNIYKMNLGAGTYTVAKTATAASGGNMNNTGDGFTAVADLDKDGYLDVIVTRSSTAETANPPAYNLPSGNPYLYAWNGRTGELFGNAVQLDSDTRWGNGPSIPFVGDITGNGTPDICISTKQKISAVKLGGDNKLSVFATMTTTDMSGATTLSMFDFNQDGQTELVYRGQGALHILQLNAAGTGFTDLLAGKPAVANCFSDTQNEFPVIADVTGDGQANIVVFGSENAGEATTGLGTVRVYRAPAGTQWAPARKVWNQWAYNVVNVNEDLTIPKVQFNPATTLDGGDCGTVRPFNAFLKQQTLLNNNGCPIWTLPNIIWEIAPTITHHAAGDSVTLTGTLKNIGDAGMVKPIYVTVYKNDTLVPPGQIIKMDSLNTTLAPGQSLPISVTVKNIASYAPISKLYIGVNDKNNKYPFQPECMVEARLGITFELSSVDAINDTVTTPRNTPITIDVLANDSIGDCDEDDVTVTLPKDSDWPMHGIAEVDADNGILYTPDDGYYGIDSLYYILTDCHGNKDSAWVFININCPTIAAGVTIAGNATTCAGTAVTFTATPTNGGSTPAYQWKKNGGNVGTNNYQYTDNTLATGDVITCVMASNDACASPATATSNGITMTVNPTTTTITGPTAVCANVEETFSVPAGSAYNWTITPSANGSFVGSTASNSVIVKLTAAATVSVSYTLNGCVVTATKVVGMNASVKATITGSAAACVGATVRYETNQGKTDYQWTIPGDYTVITGGLNQYFVELKWNAPVTGNISVNYTGICAAPSNPHAINISDAGFTATFTGDVNTCPGEATTLQFNITGGTAPYTVTYKRSGATCGEQINTMIVNGTTGTINVPASGEGSTYTIIEIKDANGCVSKTAASANVNLCNTPTAQLLKDKATYCLGDQVQISIVFSEANAAPWEVTYTDGVSNHTITITPAMLESDGRTYKLPAFTMRVDSPMNYRILRIVSGCGCVNKIMGPR